MKQILLYRHVLCIIIQTNETDDCQRNFIKIGFILFKIGIMQELISMMHVMNIIALSTECTKTQSKFDVV